MATTAAAAAASGPATSALIFGSTGAVGSHILTTLLDSITKATPNDSADRTFNTIQTISRRLPSHLLPNPPPPPEKLTMIQEADTSEWASLIPTLSPTPSVVFNAIGTTRAAAGGVQNQWSIDHDLVISTAKAAAKTAAPNIANTTPGSVSTGVRTFVFISSGGTRGWVSKYVPYSQMKIGVEDTIRDLGFECAIVLRPGMIVGKREKPKSVILETVLGNLHRVSWKVQDLIGMFVLAPPPFFWLYCLHSRYTCGFCTFDYI